LPVRSSLYAGLPSVGVSIMAAAVAIALWRAASDRARRVAVVTAVVLPFALMPIYWSRAWRWVRPAELAVRVLDDLRALQPRPGETIVLHDAQGARANLSSAFGTLFGDAAELWFGPQVRVWIEPPPPQWEQAGLRPPAPGEAVRHAVLRDGRLVAWDPSRAAPGRP
jgi:hypothetical protein